jgi:A/G-specific adenine glycosylase
MKIVSGPAKEKPPRRANLEPLTPTVAEAPAKLDAEEFRRRLMPWYRRHARVLPWRGIHDPYATWLSEIMLQQTRVAAVQDRYVKFMRRFPTLQALAKAEELEVLTLWSGLGYYRRARMLHRAAQFVVRELGGELPATAAELKTLPGIGDYTAAAIASIAFGESIAVVDGNVERVLLRIAGEPEMDTAAARARVCRTAQMLVPPPGKGRGKAKGTGPKANPPGDHNQAMMELGATICVPRGPLCLQCPVVELCRTRGEHVTLKREKQKVRRVAYLLAVRARDGRAEVLLEQRSQEASLMAGMFELPPLPLDAVDGKSPVMRVRHAITDTNYAVEIYTHSEGEPGERATGLLREIPASAGDLHWASAQQLNALPLTGLARKCLVRMGVMKLG